MAGDRLTCSAFGVTELDDRLLDFSAVIAVDAAGGNQKVLSARRGGDALGVGLRGGSVIDLLPDENGTVLMTRSYVPEARIGSLVEKRLQGLGVDRINTRTGSVGRVETPRADEVEYITNGRGKVRIMGLQVISGTGYARGAVR